MNEWYHILNRLVRKALGKTRKIAICPFGQNGILVKEILNWSYGVNEVAIIDNGLTEYNPSILSVEDLRSIDTDGLAVVLNVTDIDINKELEKQLEKLNLEIEIYNILTPVIEERPEKEDYFKHLRKLLQVSKVQGKDYVRVGGKNDGAYVMIDDFHKDMRAYSFGIGSNVSWDLYMADRGIEVFMYDHTIYETPVKNAHFHFKRQGIAGEDKKDGEMLSLRTIIKNNENDENNNLILKIDVEGAEWEALDTVPSEIWERFSQISMELHGMTDLSRQKDIIRVLKRLNRTHQVVWLHGNNGGYAERAGEVIIPIFLEVTYANRKQYMFYKDSYRVPLEIDMPNIVGRQDFQMGEWG